MKKIILICIIAIVSVSVMGQGQGKGNPSSFSDDVVTIGRFEGHIVISNKSLIKNLTLVPDPSYKNIYQSGNWATLKENIAFSELTPGATGIFWFAYRNITVEDGMDYVEENIELFDIQLKTILSRSIRCYAEFENPFTGLIERKLVLLNIAPITDRDADVVAKAGDKISFKVEVTNSDLGVGAVKMKVNNESGVKVHLQNKKLDLNFVVEAGDGEEKTFLVPSTPADGVYPFICRMDLPNGVTPEIEVQLFISNGEVSFHERSFNPLAFADKKTDFNSQPTMVRLFNERSEDVMVLIPDIYVSTRQRKTSTQLQTDPFKDSFWKGYVIPAGSSINLKLKVSSVPTIVYGYRTKSSSVVEMGLTPRANQKKFLNWYEWASR